MFSLGTMIGSTTAVQRQRVVVLEDKTVLVSGAEATITGVTKPEGTLRFATDTGRLMVSTGSGWIGTGTATPLASATSGSSITATAVTTGASATSGSSITGSVASGALSGEAIGEGTGEGTADGSTTSGALNGEAIGEGSGEGTADGSTTSGALSGEAIGEGSGEGTADGSTTSAFSLSLDGVNDYVELAGDIAVGNTWTYSVWLKPATYSSSSLFGYLAAENNDGGAGGTATRHGIGFVQSGTTNGGPGMVYYYSQTGTGSTQLSSTALTENIWNHVVVTADVSSNQMKVYLNGSLDNTISKSNIQTVFDSLGRYSNLWYYNGKMDEVAFWDSILSATEVSAIYNSGTPTDLASNAGNYSSSSNLIGWYRMEEGTGTTVADSSSNSNTGTLTNGPTFNTDVPTFNSNFAISLDGTNDYAPISGSLSAGTYDFLTSTLTYTASMWFKLDDYTQNSSQVLLANNYTSSNVGLQVWYDNRSGISTNALRVNSWAGSSVSTNTGSAITDNNWHHLVVTATGASGTLEVYLDGSSLTSTSLGATTATAPNQDLAIGGRIISGSVNSPIDGSMDEVALWSVALSASEVTDIYNSGTPTDLSTDAGNYSSSSSLVGWWRMEEGSGTSIADSSTNSNTATLTNGPTFSTNTP